MRSKSRQERDPALPEQHAALRSGVMPSRSGTDERERRLHGNSLLFQDVKVWGGIEVARYRFPPGERKVSPLRGHVLRLHQSDPHYLVQRLDGRTQASTETRSLITIIPADRPFEQIFQVESEDLNVMLPDRLIRRASVDSQIYPDQIEILDRFCAEDPHVRHIGLALGAELDSDSLGEELYAESLAYALAIHFVRKYSTQSDRAGRKDSLPTQVALSEPILRRVTDYIGDNLARRLTLSDIADAANLSPFHFSRLFKATTGYSPHQYVIQQRTERARDLLTNTDLPIHEVAWRVGFADQSHLGRHIRRRYGVTPKSFR